MSYILLYKTWMCNVIFIYIYIYIYLFMYIYIYLCIFIIFHDINIVENVTWYTMIYQLVHNSIQIAAKPLRRWSGDHRAGIRQRNLVLQTMPHGADEDACQNSSSQQEAPQLRPRRYRQVGVAFWLQTSPQRLVLYPFGNVLRRA